MDLNHTSNHKGGDAVGGIKKSGGVVGGIARQMMRSRPRACQTCSIANKFCRAMRRMGTGLWKSWPKLDRRLDSQGRASITRCKVQGSRLPLRDSARSGSAPSASRGYPSRQKALPASTSTHPTGLTALKRPLWVSGYPLPRK